MNGVGQSLDGLGLRPRQASGAQSLFIGHDQPRRRHLTAEVFFDAGGDRIGGLHRHLLTDDRSHEGMERIQRRSGALSNRA